MTETVDTLKQRVVGAFVIISLAVIFLPMIFDEPRQQGSNIIVPVPPRPSFQIKEIAKPVKPEFQRLEFNLETQKVVEEELSAKSQYSRSETAKQSIETEKETVNVPHNDNEPASAAIETKGIASKLNTAPKVEHLPIFKNVWMVQLGVFSKTENAYQLRDLLRKSGFDCHTKKIELNGSIAVKVFAGPFVDKKEAEKVKLKLDKKHQLDSKVIFFDA